jgi:hypothetical protein
LLRNLTFFCYSERMEQTPFELTPAQKGMLTTLSQETGKPVPALLEEALEALQEREHGRQQSSAPTPSPRRKQRLGEIAAALLADVPDAVLDRLPTDGAAQLDHYIYGIPKRTP